jgi:hypothetical protein
MKLCGKLVHIWKLPIPEDRPSASTFAKVATTRLELYTNAVILGSVQKGSYENTCQRRTQQVLFMKFPSVSIYLVLTNHKVSFVCVNFSESVSQTKVFQIL